MVNIDETTVYSGLGIKPETKLLGFNNKYRTDLRNKLSEVKFFITDKLSMLRNVHGEVFIQIWEKISMIIYEEMSARVLVVTVTHLIQLSLIRGKLIFSEFSNKDSMKHLYDLQL